MTDKDIKDYCKNCKVEPPAMRIKCLGCKHNPDNELFAKDINVFGKKRTMIDIVRKLLTELIQACGYDASEIEDKFDFIEMCYKVKERLRQLARKTRECEDLREALKEEIIYKRTYLKGLLDYKEECEELKEEIGKLQKSQFCVAYEKDCHKVCKQQNCAIKNSCSYRKALEEIAKIVTQDRNIKDVCLISTCLETGRVAYDIQQQIIDIINKAKGE